MRHLPFGPRIPRRGVIHLTGVHGRVSCRPCVFEQSAGDVEDLREALLGILERGRRHGVRTVLVDVSGDGRGAGSQLGVDRVVEVVVEADVHEQA